MPATTDPAPRSLVLGLRRLHARPPGASTRIRTPPQNTLIHTPIQTTTPHSNPHARAHPRSRPPHVSCALTPAAAPRRSEATLASYSCSCTQTYSSAYPPTAGSASTSSGSMFSGFNLKRSPDPPPSPPPPPPAAGSAGLASHRTAQRWLSPCQPRRVPVAPG